MQFYVCLCMFMQIYAGMYYAILCNIMHNYA